MAEAPVQQSAPPIDAFDDARRSSVQTKTLSTLALSTILTRGATSALFLVAALVIEDILGNAFWAGLSTVAITVGSAASAAIIASHMDSKGRRPGIVLGYGSAVVGAGIAVLGVERASLAIFLAGLLLVGVGSGTVNLARYAAADLTTEDRRGRDISLVIFSSTFGAIGGALVAGQFAGGIAVDAGLEENSGPILLALILFALGSAAVFALLRPDPLLLARDIGGIVDRPRRRNFGEALSAIRQSKPAQLALLSLVVSQVVMVMVMAMTAPHMKAHNHELGIIGAVLASHTAGMFAFAPIAGWVADRFGRLRAIAIGSGILVAATIITALAGEAPELLMFPGLFLLGLGWSFGIVAGSALLTESVRTEERVSVQGAADLVTNAASGLGALGSGMVFSMQGYHVLSLIGTAAAGVLVVRAFFDYRVNAVSSA